MLSRTAGKPASHTDTPPVSPKTSSHGVSKKIWLPKFVYDALPYFYVVAGVLAFLATVYISDWFWVLPHYLLFSVACVHLGVIVYRHRRRSGDPGA